MLRLGLAVVVVKGAIMAVILETLITPSFVQAVAVACSSATVSGIFLLVATHMNAKRTAEPVERVRDLVESQADSKHAAAAERESEPV